MEEQRRPSSCLGCLGTMVGWVVFIWIVGAIVWAFQR